MKRFVGLLLGLFSTLSQAAGLDHENLAAFLVEHYFEQDFYLYADEPKAAPHVAQFLARTYPGIQTTTASALSSLLRDNPEKAQSFTHGPVFFASCLIASVHDEEKTATCRVDPHHVEPVIKRENFADSKTGSGSIQVGHQEIFVCEKISLHGEQVIASSCTTAADLARQWGEQEIQKINDRKFSEAYFKMLCLAQAMNDQETKDCERDRSRCWEFVNANFAAIRARVNKQKTADSLQRLGIAVPASLRPAPR